jgi:hypothetical protein
MAKWERTILLKVFPFCLPHVEYLTRTRFACAALSLTGEGDFTDVLPSPVKERVRVRFDGDSTQANAI